MPQYNDLVLWEGVSFRYLESGEWPWNEGVCELIDESVDVFDPRISWAHLHDGLFRVPLDDAETVKPDDARFIAYGAGI